MEYPGPHYVVYNTTTNCAQGIGAPIGRNIAAFCEFSNFSDPELASWRTIPSNGTILKTQLEEMYPHNFAYCYKKKITIGTETDLCPPTALQLPVQVGFSTEDLHYSSELARF